VTGKINLDEINAVLCRACDTFCGTVDPARHKTNILAMSKYTFWERSR
jgi:hypothetical protein